MPVKLSLNIFSGRPNPYMILDDATAKALYRKLSFGALKKRTEKTTPYPSVLGYRGLIIEQQGKKLVADMPQILHYAHDMVYADGKAAKAEGGLESFLFDNFKKLRDVKDLPDFRRSTEMQFKQYIDKRKLYIENYFKNIDIIRDDIFIPRPVCPCAPAPDLAAWNADVNINNSNNCYNYGTNYRSDTFAQPGEATGQKYTTFSACDVAAPAISVKKGAISDGLVDKPNQDNKCISPGHLVGLVLYSGDYHWYRKGPNGRWSHKPGPGDATLLDSSGNVITDPRTSDNSPYNTFCTFMQVIHGRFIIT
jgi:hypothetical protein